MSNNKLAQKWLRRDQVNQAIRFISAHGRRFLCSVIKLSVYRQVQESA